MILLSSQVGCTATILSALYAFAPAVSLSGVLRRIIVSMWTVGNGGLKFTGIDLGCCFFGWNYGGSNACPSTKILLSGNRFQVKGIHTAMNPTKVIQVKTFRNRTFQQFVGNAVRSITAQCSISAKSSCEASIFSFGYAPSPKPATCIGLRGNEAHKSFYDRYASIASRHVTSLGSLCSGLHEAGNFVAARSYFNPPFRSN